MPVSLHPDQEAPWLALKKTNLGRRTGAREQLVLGE